MAADPVKLAEWLRQAMLSPKRPQITQMVLLQIFSDGSTTSARVWEWDETDQRPSIEAQLQDVIEAARDYANGKAEGTIRFLLEAYHGSMQPWGTKYPFYEIGRSPEAETGSFGQSEPATGTGLLGQLMRHLERKDDALNKMLDTVTRMSSKIIGDQETKLQRFENRHFDTIKLYEDLLDRRHDRELTAVYRAKQDARHAKIWDLVFSLGPALAANFLSPKMVAALPSQVHDGGPAMMMIRQLMKTLDESQLPKIAPHLSPDQLVLLMQLHQIVSNEVEKQNEEEEQAKHIVPASIDDMRRLREKEEREQASAAAGVAGAISGFVPAPKQMSEGESPPTAPVPAPPPPKEIVVEVEPPAPVATEVTPPPAPAPAPKVELPPIIDDAPAPTTRAKRAPAKKASAKKTKKHAA